MSNYVRADLMNRAAEYLEEYANGGTPPTDEWGAEYWTVTRTVKALKEEGAKIQAANDRKNERAKVRKAAKKQEARDNAIANLALWMKVNNKNKCDVFTNAQFREGTDATASATAATLRMLEEAGVIKRLAGFKPLAFEIL